MREVLQVAPDLVAPALDRLAGHQRQARGGEAGVGGDRQLEAALAGPGGLRLQVRLTRGRQFRIACKRVVDDAGVTSWPAAHQREVALAREALGERLPQRAGHLGAEREDEHARGASIEPVRRPHRSAELVAQALQRGVLLVRVDRGAMHQQPGRFVDHREVVVQMEESQRRGGRRGEGESRGCHG